MGTAWLRESDSLASSREPVLAIVSLAGFASPLAGGPQPVSPGHPQGLPMTFLSCFQEWAQLPAPNSPTNLQDRKSPVPGLVVSVSLLLWLLNVVMRGQPVEHRAFQSREQGKQCSASPATKGVRNKEVWWAYT